MKYLSAILILAIPLLFSTCREDDELPPITMEGKGTFGCLVNGKMMLGEGYLQNGTHADIYKGSDTVAVNIYGYRDGQTMFMSIIGVPDLKINERYSFINNDCCGLQYVEYTDTGQCTYELPISGYVTLSRWDEGKNILAGTFQFTAESDECPGTVVITEGRFDIGEIFY
ncbi:MAG: hypothetical protein WKF87_14335 [Chryseolinea sp.]